MPLPPKHALAFNDRALHAIRPSASRVDYMDLGLHGFGLMVRPSGRKTFFVRYRVSRAERRVLLGDYPTVTLATARAAAKGVVGRVATGEDPQGLRHEQRAAMTFGELAASYLEVHAKRRKRTWAEDERILNRELLPAWKSVPAAEIRRRDVARILDAIVARGVPIMANRVRALASKVFSFGLEREIVEFNPVAGLRKPGEERPRERVLAEDEIRVLWKIWEAEESITSVAFRMLLLTGQRKSEVLRMRWSDIDGTWWTLPAQFVKNKRAHRVYLADQTLALLATLEGITGGGEWVFASPRLEGRPVASLNTAKRRFRVAAQLPTWRPHDLRRTVSTFMGRLRIPRETIKRVLNHTDGSVTAIYDLAGREHEVEQALRLWAHRLDEILHRDLDKLRILSPAHT